MQTSGHGKYEALLRTTRIANERWAARHGYDYLSVTGVYEGGRDQEWLSTFNKGFMVAEAMHTSKYDLVFYMDSDAMVTNAAWDVRALPEVQSQPECSHHAPTPPPAVPSSFACCCSDIRHLRRHLDHVHARVLEWVAKSQFPRKAVVFKRGERLQRRF